ncbi:MAG: DEAD/DEAH box helicase [Candidatus Helarchaeota archaeon]
MEFKQFKLNEKLLKGLKVNKFYKPTEIQLKAIPPLLEGKSLIGEAKTGSGKTLAFGLPILQRIDENNPTIQAIIITPTRELTKQVAEEISKVAKFTKVKTMTIYGGVSFQNQVDKIHKGAQIIVATPGRLIDHLTKGLRAKPKIIVLDEADKMFDMGFFDDVNYILKLIRSKNQQFMFFGATIPEETIKLSRRYMQNPVKITTRKKDDEQIPSSIEQSYYIVAESSNKLNLIYKILKNLLNNNENQDTIKILIFVKTRIATRRLSEDLNHMGFRVRYINSDLSQAAREQTLNNFENNGGILVATDVVARGIDIEDVTCVINYDMPSEIETYVHRIGRTGRMGKAGKAITFVNLDEHSQIFQIEKNYKTKIKKRHLMERSRRY